MKQRMYNHEHLIIGKKPEKFRLVRGEKADFADLWPQKQRLFC
jgi:hypothetical protein